MRLQILVLLLASLASATVIPPLPGLERRQSSVCGDPQCCDSVQAAGSTQVTALTSLLGVVVDPQVQVGLTCTPINVLGIGGNSCTPATVCCQDNSFNGIIAVGCSPINIGL